jgi:hypothetical protein
MAIGIILSVARNVEQIEGESILNEQKEKEATQVAEA